MKEKSVIIPLFICSYMIISIFLSSTVNSSIESETIEDNSTDIIENEDKIPGIASGERKSYLKGYPGGSFEPEKEITRAEAAAIFAKLVSDQITGESNAIRYSDVGKNYWAVSEIAMVSQKGLFRGYKDGTFKPEQKITRAEFAAVVCNFLNIQVNEDKIIRFLDIGGHWAENDIKALTQKKVITGYSDGTFRPQANIKRSESVVLINRALIRGPLYGVGQIFTDVPESYWAHKDIASGAMDYRYIIDENGKEVLINK